jgi:Pyridoxamine 5'-phosphate oxidase
MMTVRWSQFEAAAPEMAAAFRKILYQHGPGLGFLATVRRDGAPRIHPICPTVVNGGLYAYILTRSPKGLDLRRDGRYALHTFPCPEVDDEFMFGGRAARVDDAALAAAVHRDLIAHGVKSNPVEETPFEFLIDRAMYAAYPGGHGTWPPKYAIWKAS